MMTGDLTRQELHHRVVPQANCAAWILGHLILSERYLMRLLGVPAETMPALPDDTFEKRYAQDEAATRAEHFGDAEVLPAVFAEHRDAVIRAVEAADDAVFDKPLGKPMRIARTVGEFLLFTPIHGASHMGQISAIRRSLGKPPVV
jgi:hypothetical protein